MHSQKIASFDLNTLRRVLSQQGLFIRTGPFIFNISTDIPRVAEGLYELYSDHDCWLERDFADFYIALKLPCSLRRWLKPQAIFEYEGSTPFEPLPLDQAFALMEWGMNWCVANHMHQYLKIHAAVLAKDGRGLVMPGMPGAGKSTLCAALVASGWQLLSDEMAILSPEDGRLLPLDRPISLKNESIELIESFVQASGQRPVFGPVAEATHKGTVVHMKPLCLLSHEDDVDVMPAWVVFPRYIPAQPTDLQAYSKALAFIDTAESSFNYSVMGADGFTQLRRVMDACNSYKLYYSDLKQGVAALESQLL